MAGEPQAWQIKDEQARSKIKSVAGEELDNLLTLLNDKLDAPLDVRLEGTKLYIEAGIKQKLASDGLDSTKNFIKKRLHHIDGVEVNPVESYIDFSNGATSGDFNVNPDVGFNVPANQYIQMGIELRKDKKYYIVWGDPNATENLTTYPKFSKKKAVDLIVIKLKADGTGGFWNFIAVTEEKIEVAGGGGGGSGSAGSGGLGSDLGNLSFRASFEDAFEDTDLADLSNTSAIFDSSAESFQLKYDTNQTVGSLSTPSGAGTSIAFLGTCWFTITTNCVVIAIIGGLKQVRKITSVTNQNLVIVESAFSANVNTATFFGISQMVQTKDGVFYYDTTDVDDSSVADLVGHIALANVSNGVSDTVDYSEIPSWMTVAALDIVLKNGVETYVSSIVDSDSVVLADTTGFGGDGDANIIRPLGSYLLNYLDDGKVTDINVAAQVITGKDLAANWALENAIVRKLNYQDPLDEKFISGTAGAHLFIRFFSNIELGYGTVNLRAYQCYYYKEPINENNGGYYKQAFGRTDGNGTEINCSISVVNSKTRITFGSDFGAFAAGVNSGKAHGELKVKLNGQIIPRYIDSVLTTGSYYVEDSGGRYIDLDSDYSGYAYTIDVTIENGIEDTSNVNAARLGLNRYFGVVGDSRADFTDWTALMAACSDGDRVVMLPGSYSWSSNYNITKKIRLEILKGVVATISATKGFSVQVDDVIIVMEGEFINSAGAYPIYVEAGSDRCSIKGSGLFNGFSPYDIYGQSDTFIDPNLFSI